MSHISTATATDHIEMDGFDGHFGQIEAFTVGFEAYSADEDPAPLFVGLPDDACQARHWGVVLEGTLVMRYTDGTEDVIAAGEAYYVPPGHTPVFKAGTRIVEFSTTEEMAATMAVVEANLAAMQAG